jgi:hypothetical protein
MNRFHERIRPDWPRVLKEILENARKLKAQGVLAFDLDSTLFNNLPRQARIVREFGAAKKIEPLLACAAEHWTEGWDMKTAMRNCGLADDQIERIYVEARHFWAERFFTGTYCLEDVEIQGAADFVNSAVAAGAQVAYLTGRHEGMREGTEQAMKRHGFALPGDADGRVRLIMKPRLRMHDDDFKRDAHAQVAQLGRLIAAFDNEPMHVNDYRRGFPDAIVVHLATDHSGRPVELLDGVVSVPHFAFL